VRVCQLCAVDFTLEHFLLPLIDGMQAQHWQVCAVCSDGPAVASLRARGYLIKTVPISRSLNPLAALTALVRLIRLFRRERFDLLHVHTPVAALIGRLAAWITGIPLVVYTAHGFYFHEGMPSWKYRLFVGLERMAGHCTDLLFTQSKEDARTAVMEGIMPEDRVLAIGNGVSLARFNPDGHDPAAIRASLGIPVDACVIGLIGRQVREKGVVEFLQASWQVADKYPQVWILLIGGRLASDHAPGVSDAFQAARALLGERLVAPGLRTDIPEMLAAMDLFCLPSWREGMPRTIIEAMLMARPVVATDIRGSREEVVHEETGLLVPVKSADLLAGAIERMVQNPAWAKSLGEAGRHRATGLYDEAKVVALQIERIRRERIQ
jgi:glycosyltransferase involved in cell wall biosynthesis